MPRGLGELRKALRDEAFHLRIVTAELRNRSRTLTRVYDESLDRIDGLLEELDDNLRPEEAQGERDRRTVEAQAR